MVFPPFHFPSISIPKIKPFNFDFIKNIAVNITPDPASNWENEPTPSGEILSAEAYKKLMSFCTMSKIPDFLSDEKLESLSQRTLLHLMESPITIMDQTRTAALLFNVSKSVVEWVDVTSTTDTPSGYKQLYIDEPHMLTKHRFYFTTRIRVKSGADNSYMWLRIVQNNDGTISGSETVGCSTDGTPYHITPVYDTSIDDSQSTDGASIIPVKMLNRSMRLRNVGESPSVFMCAEHLIAGAQHSATARNAYMTERSCNNLEGTVGSTFDGICHNGNMFELQESQKKGWYAIKMSPKKHYDRRGSADNLCKVVFFNANLEVLQADVALDRIQQSLADNAAVKYVGFQNSPCSKFDISFGKGDLYNVIDAWEKMYANSSKNKNHTKAFVHTYGEEAYKVLSVSEIGHNNSFMKIDTYSFHGDAGDYRTIDYYDKQYLSIGDNGADVSTVPTYYQLIYISPMRYMIRATIFVSGTTRFLYLSQSLTAFADQNRDVNAPSLPETTVWFDQDQVDKSDPNTHWEFQPCDTQFYDDLASENAGFAEKHPDKHAVSVLMWRADKVGQPMLEHTHLVSDATPQSKELVFMVDPREQDAKKIATYYMEVQESCKQPPSKILIEGFSDAELLGVLADTPTSTSNNVRLIDNPPADDGTCGTGDTGISKEAANFVDNYLQNSCMSKTCKPLAKVNLVSMLFPSKNPDKNRICARKHCNMGGSWEDVDLSPYTWAVNCATPTMIASIIKDDINHSIIKSDIFVGDKSFADAKRITINESHKHGYMGYFVDTSGNLAFLRRLIVGTPGKCVGEGADARHNNINLYTFTHVDNLPNKPDKALFVKNHLPTFVVDDVVNRKNILEKLLKHGAGFFVTAIVTFFLCAVIFATYRIRGAHSSIKPIVIMSVSITALVTLLNVADYFLNVHVWASYNWACGKILARVFGGNIKLASDRTNRTKW
jgi:hypothetical protein